MDSSTEFKAQAIAHLELNVPRIKKCLDQLTEEETWLAPNNSSNSVANLLLHLCGNITQWIISGMGGAQDIRKRDAEFSARGGYTKAELFENVQQTTADAIEVIKQTAPEDLLAPKPVQGFNYSGLGNVLHVVEHFSYHTGQIAFWTKQLKNQDLGFYADNDLNTTND